MKRFALLSIIAALFLCSLLFLASCDQASSPTPSTDPTATVTPTPQETPYVFPENGVLKTITDGRSPVTIDGRNPALSGNKVVVIFDCALHNAGLDLDATTEISYTAKKQDGTVYEGTAPLDTSEPCIKNQYGYVGVCLDMGFTLDKYEQATFSLSFKDKEGKEYFVKNKKVVRGISYLGLDAAAFNEKLDDGIITVVTADAIKQVGKVNNINFTFNITLDRWAGKTTPEQIVTISQLFWQCYPRMHARFGAAGLSPTVVSLDIENGGYEIASASGNKVHLHDNWLYQNKKDFDCLTHEFAHVIQNGWDGDYCEYSGYIERFADCCRYIYAYESGKYNDSCWTLQTVSSEKTREDSVRFLVWMDYTYSTEETDLLLKYFTVCRSKKYPAANWGDAWKEIFKGSALEGRNVEDVWKEYMTSEFATLSSTGVGGISPLSRKYDIRGKAK